MFWKLFGLLALVATSSAQAAPLDLAQGIWAPGKVTYLHPDGYLIDRTCNLWVPARGEGEVKLKCRGHEISTTEFSSLDYRGKKVFIVNFDNVPGAPEGTRAQYRGTYIRGSNRAIYYGDVYYRDPSADDWFFAGGFRFER